jgi:predicted lysophospholipase L1 biosynthesis ABC-type transport system permease subunit
MALGAQKRTVLQMIFRRGLLTAGTGLAIGLPIAYLLARLLASLIYGVAATDAATFVGIPLTLIAATTLAIYLPARRAMKIDPIVALGTSRRSPKKPAAPTKDESNTLDSAASLDESKRLPRQSESTFAYEGCS